MICYIGNTIKTKTPIIVINFSYLLLDQYENEQFIHALEFILFNTKKYCFITGGTQKFTILLDFMKFSFEFKTIEISLLIKTINYFCDNFPDCLDKLFIVEANNGFLYIWQMIQS